MKFEQIVWEAKDICLRLLKESNKSRFDSYSVRIAYPVLPFGIVACIFYPTTFLEIAVYRYSLSREKKSSSCYRDQLNIHFAMLITNCLLIFQHFRIQYSANLT